MDKRDTIEELFWANAVLEWSCGTAAVVELESLDEIANIDNVVHEMPTRSGDNR